MKKNTIFIVAFVAALILIIIFLAFLSAKKKQATESIQPAPSPATLPLSQGTTNRTVENSQNPQAIQQIFGDISKEPVSKGTLSNGIERTRFKNKDGSALPLDNFETAIGMQVNQQLKQFLDSSDYEVFYCPNKNNEKDFGIYLGYNIEKSYNNLYPDTLTWMKNWEKSMLIDLHSVLYPNINFAENDLGQKLDFKNGKFRFSTIRLPDGYESSINYAVVDFGVLISSSPACLEKTVSLYEQPIEP